MISSQEMRDVPVKSERLTEMTFVSVRCEIFDFTRKVQASTVDSLTGAKADDERIDAFERHLESKFFTLCDQSAPLRAMSVLMAQLELWKLRSGLYHPRMLPDSRRRQLPQAEQDMIFSACLKVMECHNAMLATESIQRFVWYAFTNPPFLAYLYLLWGLRARTKGELADRAWNQLAEHVEHRKKHDSWDYAKGSNPLRLAIANLTIKAWDARQAASPQEEVEEEPRFISDLRGRLPHGGGSGSSTAAPLTTCDSFLNPAGMPGLVPELDAFSLPDLSLDGEWPAYMDFLQGEEAMSRFGETQCFDN